MVTLSLRIRRASLVLVVITGAMLVAGSATGADAPPDTTITLGPSGTVASTSAAFEFTASQADSTFECQLDGGGFGTCTSPASFSDLAQGGHTFDVRATNVDAQTGAPASAAWTVDTVAPDTAIGSGGPSGTVSSTAATFTFSSDDPGATFQCSLDAGSFAACSSPASYTVGDGAHTFAVQAVDGAGNVDSTPASASWTVDATAPAVVITSGPSGATSSTSAAFEFTAEAGSTVECKLDTAAFGSCSSPATHSSLGEGSHVFEVRATDSTGNAGSASRTWTVDTTPPDTEIASGPTGSVTTNSATFAFSSEPSATFECRLNAAAFASCTSPTTYSALTNASHTFTVRAQDAAGNTDATPASRTWTIDTAGPSIETPSRLVAEASSAAGAAVSFAISASEGGEAVLPDGIGCSPASGSVFPLGSTTVTCSVSDNLGNISSQSFEVVVQDTTPPLPQPPGDLVIVATSPAGIESTNAAIANFVARARARDLVDANPSVKAELPATLPVGATPLSFVATDRAGNKASAASKVTVAELVPGRQAGQIISLGSDRVGPADAATLQAKPGAGYALLTWVNPRDASFDHVDIYRSEVGEAMRTTQASSQTLVYRGKGTSFKDRRAKPGVENRYIVVSFDKSGNRSLGAVIAVIPQQSFLLTPREGASVSRPPVLRWAKTNGARYFNVQIYRGSKKVLTAWPKATSLRLSTTWRYGGRVYRLTPGIYRWYVWPGLGSISAARYGALMGERTFVVKKR